MEFTKMQALGNDFVVIDVRREQSFNLSDFARRVCDRRGGVGADQLLVLEDSPAADFRMLIYNSDGSEVEMCGNGIRCFASYIWKRGLASGRTLEIETLAGIIKPERAKGDTSLIRVDMGVPVTEGRDIPVEADGEVIDRKLDVEGRVFKITCVSMGNPHAVVFLDKLAGFPVATYGPLIERHPFFPKRTNVEFVEVKSPERIAMKVWERGAGETPACGTGASAAVVAANLKALTGPKVTVELSYGELSIEWAANGRLFMTGPAVEVFEGRLSDRA